MQIKPFLLAAALITLPAATAFAQPVAKQSAPMPDASPPAASDPMQSAPPSGPASGTASPVAATAPATSADVKPGVTVYDSTGTKVGTIESATSAAAVVSTGTARAQIPIASFAKSSQGLAIAVTKGQFDAAIAKASPAKP